MGFGRFLSQLLAELGVTAAKLAELAGVDIRTVYRWREIDAAPKGEAVTKIADALCVPPNVLADAIDRRRELPREYRDRAKWLERRRAVDAARADAAGVTMNDAERVLAWYRSAPLAVRHAIDGAVPEGMEAEYLKRIADYFRTRLKGERQTAGNRRAG